MTRRTLAVVSAGLSQPVVDPAARRPARRGHRATSWPRRGADVDVRRGRAARPRPRPGQPPAHRVPAGRAARGASTRSPAADGLIAVTPIFNASYSGLFKSFFDVLDDDALVGQAGADRRDRRHRPALAGAGARACGRCSPTCGRWSCRPSVFAAPEDWAGGGADGAAARPDPAGRAGAGRPGRAPRGRPPARPTRSPSPPTSCRTCSAGADAADRPTGSATPRGARQAVTGWATSTGQWACWTSAWLTEPSSSPAKPPRPREPTTTQRRRRRWPRSSACSGRRPGPDAPSPPAPGGRRAPGRPRRPAARAASACSAACDSATSSGTARAAVRRAGRAPAPAAVPRRPPRRRPSRRRARPTRSRPPRPAPARPPGSAARPGGPPAPGSARAAATCAADRAEQQPGEAAQPRLPTTTSSARRDSSTSVAPGPPATWRTSTRRPGWRSVRSAAVRSSIFCASSVGAGTPRSYGLSGTP